MPLKILIVDDELWSREAVRLRLKQSDDFDIVGEADNGEDALLLMQSLQPDIVFLDIQMPALNGLQVAFESLDWFNGAIVFVTAYSEYAVSAFEVDAFHYLLKPIDDAKFHQLLDKIKSLSDSQVDTTRKLCELKNLGKLDSRSQPRNRHLQRISLKEGQALHIVDVQDIHYIESAGNYLGVKTETGTRIQRMTMKQIQGLLNPDQFVRCHRSTIINKSFIESLRVAERESLITTKDGKQHVISRRYLKSVKDALSGSI